MRRRVPWLVALLAAAGLGACGKASEGSGTVASTPPRATGPTGATAPAGATAPTGASAPTGATTTEPVLDDLDWRSTEHTGQPVSLYRASTGFFGVETRAVASLSATGKVRWRSKGPATDDFGGFVVDGLPFAVPATGPEPKRGYRPHAIRALDPKTGKVRWSRPSNHYAGTDGTRVYGTLCTGAETGALGDCTLTAYAPRTGRVQWTRPLYANLEGSESGDGFRVMRSFPNGEDPRYVVLDSATGAIRSTVQSTRGHSLDLVGTHLVDAGVSDPPYRGRPCRAQVTSYDLTGAVEWRRSLPVPRDGRRCESFFAYGLDDAVGLSSGSGRVRLLSAATGRTRFSGPSGFTEIAGLVGTNLLLSSDEQTIAVDPGTGRRVWRFDESSGGWRTRFGYAITNQSCGPEAEQCAVVLDGVTGKRLLEVPGVPEDVVAPRKQGGRPGLMTRIDSPTRYAARYGYVTLPAR